MLEVISVPAGVAKPNMTLSISAWYGIAYEMAWRTSGSARLGSAAAFNPM